jgi:hypothetical protein
LIKSLYYYEKRVSIEILVKIPIKNYSKKAKESFISYSKTYQQNEHIEQIVTEIELEHSV